jgi:hypothetical protein
MKMRSRSMSSLMLVLALLLGVMPTIRADPVPIPTQSGLDPKPRVVEDPPGVPADWWGTVQQDIRRSEYHVTWQDPTHLPGVEAAYQAPNRAHGLRTYFTPTGVRVIPREVDGGRWQLALGLASYSVDGHHQAVADAEPVASENRVEYQREGLAEWFVNGEGALTHGIRLAVGAHGDAPGPGGGHGSLTLDLSLGGDLVPGLAGDAVAVDLLTAEGTPVLRYAGFQATDSNGKSLAVQLELVGKAPEAAPGPLHTLRVTLGEGEATYPITLTAVLASLSSAASEVDVNAPTGLSTDPDWSAEGNVAHAEFGTCVSTAGDVNGDGYSDVIIGAPMFDGGQPEQGRVFVYHGSEFGLQASPDWQIVHTSGGMQLGYSVSIAGDVNGDGYADVIVRAPYHDHPPGEVACGRVLVYHGSATGLDLNGTRPQGSTTNADWSRYGPNPDDHLGISVATAGDVNGDGYSDVIVGAPDHDVHFALPDTGLAWVFHGSAGGLSTTSDWSAAGESTGDRFGHSVATAGDVNADNFSDVIVGAIDATQGEVGEGKAYVYHGGSAGLNASPNWTAESNQAGARFGLSVDTAGDVNGDGFSDVIIGADYYANGQDYEGGAFVYHGSGAGLGAAGTPGNADWSYESDRVWAVLGCSVSTAGDVNGDGYADVIVGARAYTDEQDKEGAAFVFHGSGSGLSTTPRWTAEGEQADAHFGVSVGTAGDVNGDGYSAVIVGARWYNNGQEKEGRTYVYHGGPVGLTSTPVWTAEGDQADAHFGISVGTAGDVNGDGYADVIVGASGYDGGEEDEGRAYVYHGSAAGLNATPDWTVESNWPDAWFGYSVGTAGDVNGDGYSDIIVGAHWFSNGQQHEGKAFVYHGSAAGLSTTPSWAQESNLTASVMFGRSVSTAGDVNGDGYSDVIVGAPGYDAWSNQGRAYVYHGSAAGLNNAADWTVESNGENAFFGSSVSTAGDVNHDGYSDVIVGAHSYSNAEHNEGKAFVYHGSPAGLGTSPAWTAEGNQASAYLGYSVGTAGDVNGDGYSDVIVGAPWYDGGEDDEGRAYVYHGASAGLTAAPVWTAEGNQDGAQFGTSVGTAGDVNGDGYADIIVGAPWYDILTFDDAGRAFAYHGSASGLSAGSDWMGAYQVQPGARFGHSVGTAGDVNGDGYADVIVGAKLYQSSPAEENEGKAFLYYGNGGDGLDLRPRQWHADYWANLAPLGVSDSPNAVRLRLSARMPLGRSKVKLHWQVAPLGTPFGAPGTVEGTSASWWNTAIPLQLTPMVSGLTAGRPYHWRIRLLYLPGNRLGQPAGRWLHMPWHGWNETDFRTRPHTIHLPLITRHLTQLTILLGQDNAEQGLTLDDGGDVDTVVVWVGSPQFEARQTGNGAALPSADGNTIPDHYMQFNADDGVLFDGAPTTRLRIEVQYYDGGTDTFSIQYDALSGGPFDDGTFKDTGSVTKTGSGQWRTAVFEVEDARFANRDHEADFRIDDHGNGAETIRRVTVTLLEPVP